MVPISSSIGMYFFVVLTRVGHKNFLLIHYLLRQPVIQMYSIHSTRGVVFYQQRKGAEMNLYTHIRGITIEIDIVIHIAVMWVVLYFYSIFEKRNRILLGKCFCYFTTRPRQRANDSFSCSSIFFVFCLLVFILFFGAFPVFGALFPFLLPFASPSPPLPLPELLILRLLVE